MALKEAAEESFGFRRETGDVLSTLYTPSPDDEARSPVPNKLMDPLDCFSALDSQADLPFKDKTVYARYAPCPKG